MVNLLLGKVKKRLKSPFKENYKSHSIYFHIPVTSVSKPFLI